MIQKLLGTIFQRHLLENLVAESKQNAADIAYVAMMCSVEMENDGKEESDHEETEEV